MSKNKYALIRYKALDNCFRNHRIRYDIHKLIEAVNSALERYDSGTNGVGRSTIYDDIAFMESSDGWNIELERVKEGKVVYMRYASPNFSINNMPLNEVEIGTLKETIGLLAQFKGMPQFEWIEEILPKLEQGIAIEKKKAVISFDSNQYLKGIEWLGILYNAITYKRALNITYKDFKSPEPYIIEIHPYYLKQYNNRWFLLGLNKEKSVSNWTMALDRIEEIKEIKTKYIANKSIDWNEYFEDIVGVTKPTGQKTEKVELLFNNNRAQYIVTKPMHGSQKHKATVDGLLVTMDLIINNEIMGLILSYGRDVVVLKPQSLRKNIRQTLSAAIEKYQDNPR